MRRASHAGFTLLEVMIATAIAAIGIVSLLELFSGSVRLARVSSQQTDALLVARAVLDRELWKADMEDGEEQGTVGDFHWAVSVEPMDATLGVPEGEEEPETVSDEYELKEVRVTVYWGDPSSPSSVSLASARVMELF